MGARQFSPTSSRPLIALCDYSPLIAQPGDIWTSKKRRADIHYQYGGIASMIRAMFNIRSRTGRELDFVNRKRYRVQNPGSITFRY
ncbi:unnamed protein product [Trichogramma brassicae]|uniref:Uncharacterized protein n=1 Tax=Trichogramma brassicae TaxID=86971 RepID=A0A6H5IVW6_9HYME|nr:unnamed protein product [Trichogramma brassicae]